MTLANYILRIYVYLKIFLYITKIIFKTLYVFLKVLVYYLYITIQWYTVVYKTKKYLEEASIPDSGKIKYDVVGRRPSIRRLYKLFKDNVDEWI